MAYDHAKQNEAVMRYAREYGHNVVYNPTAPTWERKAQAEGVRPKEQAEDEMIAKL